MEVPPVFGGGISGNRVVNKRQNRIRLLCLPIGQASPTHSQASRGETREPLPPLKVSLTIDLKKRKLVEGKAMQAYLKFCIAHLGNYTHTT